MRTYIRTWVNRWASLVRAGRSHCYWALPVVGAYGDGLGVARKTLSTHNRKQKNTPAAFTGFAESAEAFTAQVGRSHKGARAMGKEQTTGEWAAQHCLKLDWVARHEFLSWLQQAHPQVHASAMLWNRIVIKEISLCIANRKNEHFLRPRNFTAKYCAGLAHHPCPKIN